MRPKKTTPKMSGLVVAALRNLRDAHGSTAKEIMKYIMAEYNASEVTVQRQLKTALKRGVEYGILKKTTAGYSLNTDAEVIGPLDMDQVVDACKKKRRMACPRPKRKCPKKRKRNPCAKKRKRNPCPKKRKRNPCNVCSVRGRPCGQNVELVRDNSPAIDDNTSTGGGGGGGREHTNTKQQEPEKRAANSGNQDDDDATSATERASRSPSRSPNRAGKEQGGRSRSQSLGRSRYSGSDNDEDAADEDL